MGNEQGGGHKKGKKKPEDQLFDAAFEMKQQAKMLEREAAKVQQQEAKEKAKILTVRLIYLCITLASNSVLFLNTI